MKFPCISEQEECIIISVLVFGISYANEHSTQFSATAKCVWHMVITISHMQIRKHQFLPLTNTKNLRPHPPPNTFCRKASLSNTKKSEGFL